MKQVTCSDRPERQAGFSMVEASIYSLLVFVVAGFALLNMGGILPGIRANAALEQTVAQLRDCRELAIAQRRNIQIRFQGNNQIQLVRLDVPVGATVLSTVMLDNGVQFRTFGGLPDTPDSFGSSSAICFASATSLTFLSDGSLVDDQGNPLSGSVFLGLPDHPESARAVTVLGATGRIRGYRWTGSEWIH